MTKGVYMIKFLVAFVCALMVVDLIWIGSQYVANGKVVLEYTDNMIAIALSWYIARDMMSIYIRLKDAEQKAHKQQTTTQQRKRY